MRRAYEQRVREVEHVFFSPLVLSAAGGMANEASDNFLQEACLLPRHQMGLPLLINHSLATQPPDIFVASFSDPNH